MGTLVKIDTNTLNVNRERIPTICMEIDLTFPVVRKVNVHGPWYNLNYESLHIICSTCGCYGHHTFDCKKTIDKMTQLVILTVAQPRGLSKNDVVHEQRLTELHQEVGKDSAKL